MNRDARRAAVVSELYSPPDWNPDSPIALACQELHAAGARIAAAARQITRAFQQVTRAFATAGARMHRAFREAGLLPTLAPVEDPRARALYLRRHRNTGPAWRLRPPRVIDAPV